MIMITIIIIIIFITNTIKIVTQIAITYNHECEV